MEENMKTQIIKWLEDRKEIGREFEYYVDNEWFIITFSLEVEDILLEEIADAYKKVPAMISYGSYGLWEYARILVNLNHPQLKPENLYELLSALESAEKKIN